MSDYDAKKRTTKTKAQCLDAVGKRAALTLAGKIIGFKDSGAGPHVRFLVDERFGFGDDFVIEIDLDPLEVDEKGGA